MKSPYRVVTLTIMSSFILLLLATSCGQGTISPVTEIIPENVTMVKRLDMPYLLKEAGITHVLDSKGSLTPETDKLLDLTIRPEFKGAFSILLDNTACTDLSRTMAFTASAGEDIMVIPIKERSKLVSLFPSGAFKTDENGWQTAACRGMTMAIIGDNCWISKNLSSIKKAIKDAEVSHIGNLSGVRQFINGPHAASVAVKCGKSPLSFLGGDDTWFCAYMDANAASVSAKAVLIDRDGTQDSIGKDFEVINTEFLKYTPENANIIIAFGKFTGNSKALQSLLGRYAPMYLAQADGTTSLYALPAGGAESVRANEPGAWNIQTMTHLPQNLLTEGIRQYRDASAKKAKMEDGQWSYSIGANQYYFGAFDGNLVFSSNRAISGDYTNSFTDVFLNKRAAVAINIPTDGILRSAWGLPSGVTFRIELDATQLTARISFPGTKTSPLRTLLDMPSLPDMRARFAAIIGE